MYRLYSMDSYDGPLYCVTHDERVVHRTADLEDAKVFYARLAGIEPNQVEGPTNSVEVDLLIAEQCINETLI